MIQKSLMKAVMIALSIYAIYIVIEFISLYVFHFNMPLWISWALAAILYGIISGVLESLKNAQV